MQLINKSHKDAENKSYTEFYKLFSSQGVNLNHIPGILANTTLKFNHKYTLNECMTGLHQVTNIKMNCGCTKPT